MSVANFWDSPEKAQATVARLKALSGILKPLSELLGAGEDLAALLEMAEEDASLESELVQELSRMEKSLENLEIKSLLDGMHDDFGAILTINARDGGNRCQ